MKVEVSTYYVIKSQGYYLQRGRSMTFHWNAFDTNTKCFNQYDKAKDIFDTHFHSIPDSKIIKMTLITEEM